MPSRRSPGSRLLLSCFRCRQDACGITHSTAQLVPLKPNRSILGTFNDPYVLPGHGTVVANVILTAGTPRRELIFIILRAARNFLGDDLTPFGKNRRISAGGNQTSPNRTHFRF